MDKEARARRLLAEHPVEQGLICAFTTVEPCLRFEDHRSPDPHERGRRLRPRTCRPVYQYYRHRGFGCLSARLQPWFPFAIQICLNGREWLAEHLQRQGVEFRRHANAFTWLGDPARAQRLLAPQLTAAGPRALAALARALPPLHAAIFRPGPQRYSWSTYPERVGHRPALHGPPGARPDLPGARPSRHPCTSRAPTPCAAWAARSMATSPAHSSAAARPAPKASAARTGSTATRSRCTTRHPARRDHRRQGHRLQGLPPPPPPAPRVPRLAPPPQGRRRSPSPGPGLPPLHRTLLGRARRR